MRLKKAVDENKKMDLQDMQRILRQSVAGGKVTVWNQLLVQHPEVGTYRL